MGTKASYEQNIIKAYMLPMCEKAPTVSSVCNREEQQQFFVTDGGGCVHPYTRVLHAMHFAVNVYYTTREYVHISPAVAA